jgi:hypothetical protein
MAVPPSPAGIRNQLLASLPPDMSSRLLPRMRPVSLTVCDTQADGAALQMETSASVWARPGEPAEPRMAFFSAG